MNTSKLNQALFKKNDNDASKNGEGFELKKIADFVASDNENICTGHQNTARKIMEEATRNLTDAQSRVLIASKELHMTIDDLAPKTKKSVSLAKDQANQMADFLGKLNRMLGDDFDKRLNQLKEMTECLEKLERIQRNPAMRGVVSEIFKGVP